MIFDFIHFLDVLIVTHLPCAHFTRTELTIDPFSLTSLPTEEVRGSALTTIVVLLPRPLHCQHFWGIGVGGTFEYFNFSKWIQG